MIQAPDWYARWYASLDLDRIYYGVGGIKLFQPQKLPEGQTGYAVAADGEVLTGEEPGDWRPEWVVIGRETACGDPIFAPQIAPHPVFTAMHGEGSWEPKLIAPSIQIFGDCMKVFGRFASGLNEANPPSEQEQRQFLNKIRQLTGPQAWEFWAVQIDVDPEGYEV